MISQTTIQTILELPLDVAIGQYVTLQKKTGGTYLGKSPFNDEKTPSFNVHTARGFWKDFSSGNGGRNVISFLMKKEGLTFPQAVERAAQDNNIQIEYDTPEQAEKYKAETEKRHRLVPVLDWAFANISPAGGGVGGGVPEDFLKRFPKEVCEQFNIGYCTGLITEAKKAAIDLNLLAEVGLIGINVPPTGGERGANPEPFFYEKFINRIIFPIYDYNSHLIGFTGRIRADDMPPSGGHGGVRAKYMHSAFEKSKTLFAIHKAGEAMRNAATAYIVEGPTDCMRFHQYGYTNTAAIQGSDLSEEQCKLIKRFCPEVTLVADADEPGLKALHRNAETAIKNGLTVKVLIPGKK